MAIKCGGWRDLWCDSSEVSVSRAPKSSSIKIQSHPELLPFAMAINLMRRYQRNKRSKNANFKWNQNMGGRGGVKIDMNFNYMVIFMQFMVAQCFYYFLCVNFRISISCSFSSRSTRKPELEFESPENFRIQFAKPFSVDLAAEIFFWWYSGQSIFPDSSSINNLCHYCFCSWSESSYAFLLCSATGVQKCIQFSRSFGGWCSFFDDECEFWLFLKRYF